MGVFLSMLHKTTIVIHQKWFSLTYLTVFRAKKKDKMVVLELILGCVSQWHSQLLSWRPSGIHRYIAVIWITWECQKHCFICNLFASSDYEGWYPQLISSLTTQGTCFLCFHNYFAPLFSLHHWIDHILTATFSVLWFVPLNWPRIDQMLIQNFADKSAVKAEWLKLY